MSHTYHFVLFVVGLAFGSFLNVVSLRYKLGGFVFSKEVVKGRSRCLGCKRILRWPQLVPVLSFVFLGGRCGNCKSKIFLQYPLAELFSGLIFVFVPFYFQRFFGAGNIFPFRSELWSFYLFVSVWVVILWVLLLISVIDFRHYVVPNELNLLLVFLGGLAILIKFVSGGWLIPFHDSFLREYAFLFSPFGGVVAGHVVGFLIAGFFFWFLVFITKGKGMGFGDVKLAFALGLVLGWPDVLMMIMLAFVIGGFVGLALILGGKRTLKGKVPFAPFMALGVLGTVFFGYQILSLYFGLFSV